MLISLDGHTPELGEDAWVAPTATLIGQVRLGPQVGIWYGTVIRADLAPIVIGANSNIQDGCALHADPRFPLTVGTGVSVGHNAILHGCTVKDDVLVGMGATVLNGARIGAGSLIAAGALVPEGTKIPPGSLVAGVPGRVRRQLTETDQDRIRQNARIYLELKTLHAGATTDL
ncbi:gamma carbonic anhydrase family protein [Flexivirga caeni]|uniref:Gamma carbonic anhydrase family protein n=1 Tax=Flexivirga caeni TaxID=2294115 RepID=A0A3M9MIK6_9MICO|nr:gamma carbonic anhydrase family protein [Flexivirga caeni]RNI25409.1 gamma carbonic anhydrase family protein [Flexivirga caeni]